jgi:hypothetical protein
MPRLAIALGIVALLAVPALAADPAAVPARAPVVAAPVAAPPAPPKPSGPSVAERQAAFSKEIREVSTKLLGAMDPDLREQGRQRLLVIRDPAAVEPVTTILGKGTDDMRVMACEMLGQIPGDAAGQWLARCALADTSEPVRGAAVKALKTRPDRLALPFLLNGLKAQGDTFARAAFALGEAGDLQAAMGLLAYMRKMETVEVEVTVTGSDQPAMFSGKIQPYIAGATTVVGPGGTVATKPIIGYSGSGVGLGGMPQPPQPQVIKKATQVLAPQPLVLEALKKITGQNFEFRTEDWRKWITKAIDAEKAGQKANGDAPHTTPLPPPPQP